MKWEPQWWVRLGPGRALGEQDPVGGPMEAASCLDEEEEFLEVQGVAVEVEVPLEEALVVGLEEVQVVVLGAGQVVALVAIIVVEVRVVQVFQEVSGMEEHLEEGQEGGRWVVLGDGEEVLVGYPMVGVHAIVASASVQGVDAGLAGQQLQLGQEL